MIREIKYHFDGLGLTELCRVLSLDEPHPVNGAHHQYGFMRDPEPGVSGACCGVVQFQRGPRTAADSTPGTLDGALLSVLIDRQECFQAGPFACEENAEILGHLREALRLTIARARERAARGVLGTNAK